jgi:hypothetical protein
VLLLLTCLLVSGCAIGGDDASDVSDTPRRDFAGRPVPQQSSSAVIPSSAAASSGATPTGTVASAAGTSGTTAASSTPAGGTQQGSAVPAAPYRRIASLDDPASDQGLGAPPYADVRNVLIEDVGTNARVSVHLGGSLPAKAAAGEAIGIGVDFYRTATQQESDYQLFADGGPDGWFAYLHTPKGFVRYPGSFSLLGNGLSFTVPWTSLGKPTAGRFSAFEDWTQKRTSGNAAANDRAPLVGNSSYTR